VLIGDAFSFDNPQSLETQLEEAFDINQVEFNLLYSVYSIPNVILPLFGGYLIDRCGVRVNIVLFATLLVLG
jgi:fucose permease